MKRLCVYGVLFLTISSSSIFSSTRCMCSIRLRLHKQRDQSFAFEAAPFESEENKGKTPEWTFVRIGHLSSKVVSKGDGENPGGDGTEDWKMGVFAASPIEQVCEHIHHLHHLSSLISLPLLYLSHSHSYLSPAPALE